VAAGLAEQHAHQIFDEKALERPCSKGCHERRSNIHFLKRLEHVPVAKSDAKNAFFARRERNFSFEVPGGATLWEGGYSIQICITFSFLDRNFFS
jgi:hypothetical protein